MSFLHRIMPKCLLGFLNIGCIWRKSALLHFFILVLSTATFLGVYNIMMTGKLKINNRNSANVVKDLFNSQLHDKRVPLNDVLNGVFYNETSSTNYSHRIPASLQKVQTMTEGDKGALLSLSQYYQRMGARIISTQDVQLFVDLYHQNYTTTTMNRRRKLFSTGNDSQVARLTLEYLRFNQTVPRFVSERDRDIFYMSKENTDVLLPAATAQLTGDIGILYTGDVDLALDCGWRNSMQDYYHKKTMQWNRSGYLLAPKRLMSTDHGSELFVPLLVPNGGSFQHFMDGMLPKLAQIAPFLNDPAVKIMLEDYVDDTVPEMLAELGFDGNRLVYYRVPVTLDGYQLNTCVTPPLHPGLWSKMRELLGVREHLQVPMADASVILLIRDLNSRNGGRNIVNKQEVISYLYSRYKERLVLFHGGYNLTQSKAMFGRARLVLGIHGGAFYNINFSPAETVVAEYLPLDEHQPFLNGLSIHIVWTMANMNRQPYYRLTERPLGASGNLNITIPKLIQLLDEIDGIQLRGGGGLQGWEGGGA